MSKHTPGPWEAYEDPKIPWGFQIIGRHPSSHPKSKPGDTFDAWIASARAGELGTETNRANARLIAAAPELLEALNWIVNNASSFGLEAEPYVERAKAALAKAEAEDK